MNNPFDSSNKTALAVSLTIGTIATGAAAWLFFTKSGSHMRGQFTRNIKDAAKDIAATFISNHTNISKKTLRAIADHVVKS